MPALPAPRALPAELERTQILGLDTNTSLLQGGHGLQSTWFATQDGGNYTLLDPSPVLAGREPGNLVLDARGAAWQLESTRFSAQVRGALDGALHLVQLYNSSFTTIDTGLPPPEGLPSLAESNGTLWTTTEHQAHDGSLRVHAARSPDGGQTWQTWPVSRLPRTATLSSIAASGNRAAIAYYGADTPGHPSSIHASWSYYIAETDNAMDARPVWREHPVAKGLHTGALCAGPCNTESLVLGDPDPHAGFVGRGQGIAIDADGNVHAAFVRELELEQFALYYVRQHGVLE